MTGVLYNADYYKNYVTDYSNSEFWSPIFGRIADRIIEDFAPKTVLDAGCAYGYLVAALRDRGVDAFGIDISKHAIFNVRDDIKPYCSVCSLTDPLPENFPDKFDLITCIEVLEHMYEDEGTLAIENLCRYTENIIFSSTPSDLKDPTHFNVQQQEYWAKRFAKNGFYNQITYSANYISPVAVYFKRSDSIPKIIEDYERNTRIIKQNTQEALSKIQELTNQKVELEKAYSEQKNLNLELENAFTKQKNQIEEIEKQNVVIQNAYQGILSSRSWRITKPIRYVLDRLKRGIKTERNTEKAEQYTDQLVKISDNECQRQVRHVFLKDIKISILVPLYNTPEKFLCEMIESVQKQTYSNWELCMADGSDDKHKNVMEICEKYCVGDKRIKYKKLGKNLGISLNTNECISMATGEYIALFDHDDIMHQSALFHVMEAICGKDADFVYTDEATFENVTSNIVFYHFKPDFAPDTLRSYNYICHLSVVEKKLLDKVGWLNPEYDGSQDYDLILRLTEQANNIVHVPKILYFWRSHPNSVAKDISAKSYCLLSARKAIAAHLKRKNLSGEVSDSIVPSTYKINYKIEGQPLISIIIPNKDHINDLCKCISSINDSTYRNYEIIIVENNSEEQETHDYYKSLEKNENIKIIYYKQSFNFSAVCNFGVLHARGEQLLFLNNDTEVITPNWMEEMLMFSQREDVGAVGAMLYYPDDTVQHAGVILGIGGVADHAHKNFKRDDYGYVGRLTIAQNLSAVTGACMMMRKRCFEEVGGFDERLAVAFNDIDLCMKIRQKGYLIIFTPYAELYHYESKSRGYEDTPDKKRRFQNEVLLFREKWIDVLDKGDPYYNPNLTLDRNDFSFK